MPPRLVVLAAVSALLGCSEPVTVPLTVQDLFGTYALTGINGRLPYPVTFPDCDGSVQDGVLTLEENSVTTPSGNFDLVLHGQSSCTVAGFPNYPLVLGKSGTYTVSGTTVHFVTSFDPSPIEFKGQVNSSLSSVHVSALELYPSIVVDLDFRRKT